MIPEKAELLQKLYRDPSGKPLKTALAQRFPTLTRKQRREMFHVARRAAKKEWKKQRRIERESEASSAEAIQNQ